LEITSNGYIIQYDNSANEEEIFVEDINQNLISVQENCLYCSTELLRVEGEDVVDHHLLRKYGLWYCRNCRFWQSILYFDPHRGCLPGPDHWAYVSKIREFQTNLPYPCDSEIASWIRRNPSFIHSYNQKRFEKFIADVFRANFVAVEVIHVGKPDDGGVDVKLIDSESEQWLVQVKRREFPNRSEGIETIRDLLGAMVLEGAFRGIVVTTSNQFSLRAKQAVGKAGQFGNIIKLIDKGILNRMLDPILPDRPWLGPIRLLDKELALWLANEIPSDLQLSMFSERYFQLK
jgi:hypothetical protein